jgi:hypothetical protein
MHDGHLGEQLLGPALGQAAALGVPARALDVQAADVAPGLRRLHMGR